MEENHQKRRSGANSCVAWRLSTTSLPADKPREEEEEATNEAEEEEVQDGAQERAALAEELEAADASESEEEAEESAPIVTDEDVSGEECEGMVQPVPQTVTAQE